MLSDMIGKDQLLKMANIGGKQGIHFDWILGKDILGAFKVGAS
jgi:hypothetical protein